MRFISRYTEYEMVMIPSTITYFPDGKSMTNKGKSIRFVEGVYETKDEEEIKFLKSHKDFGSIIVCYDDLVKEQYQCPCCKEFKGENKAEMQAHLLVCKSVGEKEKAKK